MPTNLSVEPPEFGVSQSKERFPSISIAWLLIVPPVLDVSELTVRTLSPTLKTSSLYVVCLVLGVVPTKLIELGAVVSNVIPSLPLPLTLPAVSFVHTYRVLTPSPELIVAVVGLEDTHPPAELLGAELDSDIYQPATPTPMSVSFVMAMDTLVELVYVALELIFRLGVSGTALSAVKVILDSGPVPLPFLALTEKV